MTVRKVERSVKTSLYPNLSLTDTTVRLLPIWATSQKHPLASADEHLLGGLESNQHRATPAPSTFQKESQIQLGGSFQGASR
jgi:hypothetical protein